MLNYISYFCSVFLNVKQASVKKVVCGINNIEIISARYEGDIEIDITPKPIYEKSVAKIPAKELLFL